MKSLQRILKGFAAAIALAKQRGRLVRLEVEAGAPALVVLAAQKGAPAPAADDVAELAYAASTAQLKEFFADPALERRARTDVLMGIAGRLGYFCFAGVAGEIYLSAPDDLARDLEQDLKALDRLFRRDFGAGLNRAPAGETAFAIAEGRVEAARGFFVREKGPWIENFMAKLGDDISRDSLLTYLRQRIMAKIFWDSDICYPVEPPASTAAWRKEREARAQDYPVLKDMRGDVIADIYYQCVYVYEQYGIPGQVEVMPGDTVIDAGAFVGDSSVWFSRRTGPEGRVYAFEIFPESVACGRENMKRNGADNVEYVNAALSEHTGRARLVKNDSCASQSRIVFGAEATDDGIDTIALDDFRKRSGPIRFIKADIEGSEMAMLRGARETIARDAPTCAICVYHKRDDFWEIPDFLASLRPDYTFWFRCEAEPVLYARCETPR